MVLAFHFRVFPILWRLSHYLRAWNRLVDTRHIELKEEPKVKHLNWLTCNFASCRKRTQTSGGFICRFGLHWFRADYNVCDGKKLLGPSTSVFMGSFNSYELFSAGLSIIPDFPNPNIHYWFSIKPCYYPLFTFHPQTWYNQLLSNWLPINYTLITHWCHRLVSSRVSSGKRFLLCGRPAKLKS